MQRKKWFEEKGDETLALDWPIGPESLVWEIGGYKGRWAKQMYDKYQCYIDIYEPQPWAYEILLSTFGVDHPKVSVKNYGLWVMDANLPLYGFETDGASIIPHETNNSTKNCDFHNIGMELQYSILAVNFTDFVDVCLMNVEGAEYVLIPHMIGAGIMDKIRFFWCQFHPRTPYDEAVEDVLFRKMEITHRLLWDCYPTAVAWERK